MKTEIDAMIAEYGNENAPPPWAVYSVPNDIKEGNLHIVQKVFEGPFEVGCDALPVDMPLKSSYSSMLFTLRVRRTPLWLVRLVFYRGFLHILISYSQRSQRCSRESDEDIL